MIPANQTVIFICWLFVQYIVQIDFHCCLSTVSAVNVDSNTNVQNQRKPFRSLLSNTIANEFVVFEFYSPQNEQGTKIQCISDIPYDKNAQHTLFLGFSTNQVAQITFANQSFDEISNVKLLQFVCFSMNLLCKTING